MTSCGCGGGCCGDGWLGGRWRGRVEPPLNGRQRHPHPQAPGDAVGDSRKRASPGAFVFDSRRVLEAPMDALGVPWKHRTGFRGPVTDGNHVIESLTKEAVHRLGMEIVG